MRSRLERPFALAWAVLCPIIAATLGPDLQAEVFGPPDPPPLEVSRTEPILFIGNLNADCYPDTVVGDVSGGIPARSLPAAIRWGQPRRIITYDAATGQHDTTIADSSCLGTIPPDRKVAVTAIHYPAWEHLSGAVAFNRVNLNDSLDDMTIFIRGTVGDSLHRTDTLRALTLFAQEGIDSLPVLDLVPIETFQVAPFFAMELRVGSELVEPEVRDLSGMTSYVIQPVSLGVGAEHHDTTITPGDSTPAQPIRLRVYPNPTGGAAQVQVDSIPPGDYSVDVVAVNGHVYLHQEVTVSMAGTLFEILDVHTLPTGFYVVRISDDAHLLGLYPIVITR
jgi:hypothetical protein